MPAYEHVLPCRAPLALLGIVVGPVSVSTAASAMAGSSDSQMAAMPEMDMAVPMECPPEGIQLDRKHPGASQNKSWRRQLVPLIVPFGRCGTVVRTMAAMPSVKHVQ